MFERQRIKYGLLITLLILITSQNIHFGDYCEGLASGLLLIFLYLFFILIFTIIEISDIYKLVFKKQKFDYIPLIIFMTCILLNWFLIIASDNKYWKSMRNEGMIDDIDSKAYIILFENNTFEVTKSYIEERCTHNGKYHFEKGVLTLEDENIESKSDNNFTKEYVLINDSILEPIDKKYKRIKLNRK